MGNRLSKEVDYESAGRPFESGRARQFESENCSNLAPSESVQPKVGRSHAVRFYKSLDDTSSTPRILVTHRGHA
jgi:hypothetical protein